MHVQLDFIRFKCVVIKFDQRVFDAFKKPFLPVMLCIGSQINNAVLGELTYTSDHFLIIILIAILAFSPNLNFELPYLVLYWVGQFRPQLTQSSNTYWLSLSHNHQCMYLLNAKFCFQLTELPGPTHSSSSNAELCLLMVWLFYHRCVWFFIFLFLI